jgi:hypothetical protein
MRQLTENKQLQLALEALGDHPAADFEKHRCHTCREIFEAERPRVVMVPSLDRDAWYSRGEMRVVPVCSDECEDAVRRGEQ